MTPQPQPQPLDREKLLSYLLGEIEHPQCHSPKCVCLNLKQKIEYGDFDCASHTSAGSQQRIEQAINQLETEARVLRSDAREYSDYMRSARAAGIERALALLQAGDRHE